MPAMQGLTLPFLFGEGKDQKIYGSMQLNIFETTTLLLYIYVKHCNRSCLFSVKNELLQVGIEPMTLFSLYECSSLEHAGLIYSYKNAKQITPKLIYR